MSPSGGNLNQSSEREAPRSRCCFSNTFTECHFFPTLPFLLLNFHTMSLLWPSPEILTKTKKLQLDSVFVSAAAKVEKCLKPIGKHWVREEERPVPERFKVCSSSKDLAAKASLLYYVNIVCLTKCSNSKVHFFIKPWPSMKIKSLLC